MASKFTREETAAEHTGQVNEDAAREFTPSSQLSFRFQFFAISAQTRAEVLRDRTFFITLPIGNNERGGSRRTENCTFVEIFALFTPQVRIYTGNTRKYVRVFAKSFSSLLSLDAKLTFESFARIL